VNLDSLKHTAVVGTSTNVIVYAQRPRQRLRPCAFKSRMEFLVATADETADSFDARQRFRTVEF
jgi:hypothetical protein